MPDGYRLRAYRRGDAANWLRIHLVADRGNRFTRNTFNEQFPGGEAVRRRRILFAEDARGRCVGTVAAWYGKQGPGGAEGLLHWLAVRPAHQGRGLGWALTVAVLHRLARWHRYAVLDTDHRRRAALRLYERAGFRRVGTS